MSIIETKSFEDESLNRNDFKHFIENYKNKILIFYFGASWCNPCKTAKPHIETYFQKMKLYQSQKAHIYYIDVDKQSDIASHLKIRKLPTLLSFHDGYQQHVLSSTTEGDIQYFFEQCDKLGSTK